MKFDKAFLFFPEYWKCLDFFENKNKNKNRKLEMATKSNGPKFFDRLLSDYNV